MTILKSLFTWWNDATIGTQLWARYRGKEVGRDESGNIYYEEAKASRPNGRKRRWVIYNGTAEASRVPVEWHGWLHHTFDEPPSKAPFATKEWEKDHSPNLTGTEGAYRPSGSLWKGAQRPHATGDYEPWQPE